MIKKHIDALFIGLMIGAIGGLIVTFLLSIRESIAIESKMKSFSEHCNRGYDISWLEKKNGKFSFVKVYDAGKEKNIGRFDRDYYSIDYDTYKMLERNRNSVAVFDDRERVRSFKALNDLLHNKVNKIALYPFFEGDKLKYVFVITKYSYDDKCDDFEFREVLKWLQKA